MGVSGLIRAGVEGATAEAFDKGMTRAFPVLCTWRDMVRELGQRDGLLISGFGRVMRCNPQRAYTQAPALMGQGTARDLMRLVVLRLLDQAPWLAQGIRLMIHDELLVQVPEEQAEEARSALASALSFFWRPQGLFPWAPQGCRLSVPIDGEVSGPGRSWADCYR
jgi:hypothetical protein